MRSLGALETPVVERRLSGSAGGAMNAGGVKGGKGAKRKRGALGAIGERTFVAAILVGRDGQVLWYKDLAVAVGAGEGEGIDLRVKGHSRALIGALFE